VVQSPELPCLRGGSALTWCDISSISNLIASTHEFFIVSFGRFVGALQTGMGAYGRLLACNTGQYRTTVVTTGHSKAPVIIDD
jgi:hypothetical protein